MANHACARLNWVTAHHRWTINEWNKVLFSNESRFHVSFSDGRAFVWRAKGEHLDVSNVQQGDRFGCRLVMAWGGIYKNGKTELITMQGTNNST